MGIYNKMIVCVWAFHIMSEGIVINDMHVKCVFARYG